MLYFLLFCLSFISAEPPAPPPKPSALQSNWWNYFDPKSANLEARITPFKEQLKRIEDQASPEMQVKLAPLVQKNTANLNALLQAYQQPPVLLPEAPALKSIYSVTEVVQLYRDLHSKEVLLATDKDDAGDRERQILAAQERLSELQAKYVALPPNTQEKQIAGIEFINFRLSLEIIRAKHKRLKQVINVTEKQVKRSTKQLDAALNLLSTSPQEKKQVTEALTKATERLEKEKDEHRRREAKAIEAFSFDQSDETAKLNNQLLEQRLLEASVDEALAQNAVIFIEVQKLLIDILHDEVEPLSGQILSWADAVSDLKQKSNDWDISLKRDIQRVEEWLSINTDPGDHPLRDFQLQILSSAQNSLVKLIRLSTEIQESEYLIKYTYQRFSTTQGGLWSQVLITLSWVTGGTKIILDLLKTPLFYIGDTVVTLLGVVRFFLIIVGAYWFSHFSSVALTKLTAKRRGLKKSLVYRINRLAHYLILATGFIIALSSLGFDFSSLVLVAGALGVGLGFGLQTIFNNFVSGLMILFENQLKVGDYVELESGVCGEVREINFRSTYIKTNDGVAIVVPNSEFISGRVVNWTLKEPYRRVRILFSVAYDSDKAFIEKIIKDAVKGVDITLEKAWAPEPRIYLDHLGPNSLEFTVLVWVNDKATKRSSFTKSVYLWAIHDALLKNGIEIPYPQHDLHINSIFDAETMEAFIRQLHQK